MQARNRRDMVRSVFQLMKDMTEVDLWAVYKWSQLAGFPSQSGGGGSGQKGEGDPVGDKATAAAMGHHDDPSVKAALDMDQVLPRILADLMRMRTAIATTKPPHVMSDKEKEQCEGCGCFRFEKPSGWTLGRCRACYDVECKKAKRRKK